MFAADEGGRAFIRLAGDGIVPPEVAGCRSTTPRCRCVYTITFSTESQPPMASASSTAFLSAISRPPRNRRRR